MRTSFDFAPYRRSTVGFDRLFDMLENNTVGNGGENYPPFDLIKTGENDYRIELAVAGFKPDEIDITAQQNVLIVSGRKKEESEEKGSDYIYRGIATRSFERRFASCGPPRSALAPPEELTNGFGIASKLTNCRSAPVKEIGACELRHLIHVRRLAQGAGRESFVKAVAVI
jgi:HSP20 family molecular chaperone IbpA